MLNVDFKALVRKLIFMLCFYFLFLKSNYINLKERGETWIQKNVVVKHGFHLF